MANNSHGINNELEMANYLDNKKYRELNLTMKEFIKYICQTKNIIYNEETKITAEYVKNNKLKEDIYITINNIKIGISLKMGSGNSCHQEKIEDFIHFIKMELNASNEICDLWRFFIWADGTLDGSGAMDKDANGRIICRCGAALFKKKYPQKREILQKFVNENIDKLLTRAIFIGKYNSDVEFVYHGTYKQGRWISRDEVIDFQKKQIKLSNNACLKLGNLTIQMWNPSEYGTAEHKRGEIQIKYASMKKDFEKIMKKNATSIGTFFGDFEEFDLSQLLNKNKNHSMWNILLPNITDFTNYYLIKVSSNQMSSLSGKKVKTKSDAYVVKMQLNKEFLLSKEYILDENDIKGKTFEIQHNTGISIKMKTSKSFTYQKFTTNSFYKAFSNIPDVKFWFTSLLVYSTDNERYKNDKIITDLQGNINAYLNKVNTIMNIPLKNIEDSSFWNLIRKTAQQRIKTEIQSNHELAENIFMGKHWFTSPYHAIFLYESDTLKRNKISDFSITTGSGRSKGKYSIEIIPI